jgi:hypothetical protein
LACGAGDYVSLRHARFCKEARDDDLRKDEKRPDMDFAWVKILIGILERIKLHRNE